MLSEHPEPLLVGVDDAKRILGIGRTLLFQLARDGELARVKIHSRTLFRYEDLREYVLRLSSDS